MTGMAADMTSWQPQHPPGDRPDEDRGERAVVTRDSDREVPLIDDTDIVVLPDQTSDDMETDWPDSADVDREVRLLEDVPPHWH